ncbi:MAG TPA: SCO family protein [Chloroflexota bacterium]
MGLRHLWLATALLAGLVLLAGGAAARGGWSPLFPGSSSLVGTDLGAKPAPDFHLVDQFGESLALSDLRGKPVVLTFLYTSCPDTCPIVTAKFAQVHRLLGERAQDVALVAVTVDPERDTVARLRQFLEAQGLADVMRFLTGDRASLEATWAAYYIGVQRMEAGGHAADHAAGGYTVAHNDALYVIDKHGRQRVLMREDFAVEDMVRNLETLLREP